MKDWACRKAQLFEPDGNSLTVFLLLLANTNNTQTLGALEHDTSFRSPETDSMWLLNAETYRHTYFHDSSTVGYAILSHTWDDEEVSFQQIQDLESARRLRGFEKIRLTCEEARSNGLSYAWVDTCCIDKTSSAELSEAINSMFRYYATSRICYVLLSDITATDAEIENIANIDVTSAWLGKSRWFTRGWTLQELIAPNDTRFFSRHWRQIGSKDDLAECLARITGIHLAVLYTSEVLGKYSIAQRMSWAAGRETSRLEDRAYSLLGLFGINMPLLYGEGKNAFTRLQQEIVKGSDDQSIFLWSSMGSSSENFKILAPTPDHFRNARKIVTVSTATSRPFEFTNSGLRIELCELSVPEGRFLVFNCRFCDDFGGQLALPIKHTEVENKSEESKPVSVPRHALARSVPRVVRWSGSEVLVHKTCILADHALDLWLPRATAAFSLWFRESSSFSSAFWIIEAYPRPMWNEESAVMQWPREPGYAEGVWGYITWRRLNCRLCVTVVFKSFRNGLDKVHYVLAIAYTRHGLSTSDCERWASAIQEPPEAAYLYHIGTHILDSCHFVNRIVPYEGRGDLGFSAKVQELMDETVCVIDITLGGTAVTPFFDARGPPEEKSSSRTSFGEHDERRTSSIEGSNVCDHQGGKARRTLKTIATRVIKSAPRLP